MLQITVPATDLWDEEIEEFVSVKEHTLRLEHSLVSISKWESKWHKAYLGKQEKTQEETVDYIRCMTLTQNVDPNVYKCLTQKNVDDILAYIADPMTSAKFPKDDYHIKGNTDTPMNEIIYYWMISFNIPVEFEKWHLNHLMALIRICNMKNTPPKKVNGTAMARQRAALNQARRQRLHSKG